ncbi:PP2C family protein-serine/threonine phosphatase [Pseudonocardia sp. CA-107938]|uniref:PP2C family protein-serine/threonine phosphatase n=1 Tax=Pseudonocardia sp. CA-107938 TaxID=3240021 RepID=UPI003D94AB62
MSADATSADAEFEQTPLRVLLVEDDEGDALLVHELLTDAGQAVELVRAGSLAEAEARWSPDVDCVLLDMVLPDSDGLDGLVRMRARGAGAVVVLTGFADRAHGLAAVAAGAQDYLVKGRIDGPTLERAVRYAVHRHRADQVTRELAQANLLAAENLRLSRGLLPAPLLDPSAIGYAARYLPGGARLLLGGDFYDAVQVADGSVWVLIGDVCGHGADEAALGVALRIAWRTLVLAGHPAEQILPTLHEVLVNERHQAYLFATAMMVRIAPGRKSALLWSAGHPPAVMRTDDGGWHEVELTPQLPLGVVAELSWTAVEVPLGPRWDLLLYTDGLIEGRATPDGDQLWVDGLCELLPGGSLTENPDLGEVLDELLAKVAGSTLTHDDDIAVVLLSHPGPAGGT